MKKLVLFLMVPAIIFSLIPHGLAATSVTSSSGLMQIYPGDYIWNVPVDTLPVDAKSSVFVNSSPSANLYLYKDFPYNLVNSSQPKQKLSPLAYPIYSDDIPYPIPDSPLIENNRDQHMVILNLEENRLYEMYHANRNSDGTWGAGVAVTYNLSDYTLRPQDTVSADAAGLPILPGLIRYEEVDSGAITHALRFATNSLQNTYIWPARAAAGSDNSSTSLPPHGQRFRLKSSFNTSGYSSQEQVVLKALKTYGMILADYNGGDPTVFSIYAAPDERWAINFTSFKDIRLTDFEAVDESSLMINVDSGQARIVEPGSWDPSLNVWIIAVACTLIAATSYGVILLKGRFRRTLPNKKWSVQKTMDHGPARLSITEETIPEVSQGERSTAKVASGTLRDLKAAVKKTTSRITKTPRIIVDSGVIKPGSPTLPDLKAYKKTDGQFTKPPRITEETIPGASEQEGSAKSMPANTGREKETNGTSAELSRSAIRKGKNDPGKNKE